MHLAWNPNDNTQFATVGKDHMYLCSFDKEKLKVSKKKGSMKTPVSFSSIAWSHKNAGTFFTGGSNGSVCTWNGNSMQDSTKVCKGAV
jgi:WD40 repeat protein